MGMGWVRPWPQEANRLFLGTNRSPAPSPVRDAMPGAIIFSHGNAVPRIAATDSRFAKENYTSVVNNRQGSIGDVSVRFLERRECNPTGNALAPFPEERIDGAIDG